MDNTKTVINLFVGNHTTNHQQPMFFSLLILCINISICSVFEYIDLSKSQYTKFMCCSFWYSNRWIETVRQKHKMIVYIAETITYPSHTNPLYKIFWSLFGAYMMYQKDDRYFVCIPRSQKRYPSCMINNQVIFTLQISQIISRKKKVDTMNSP